LGRKIFAIERIDGLARDAENRLKQLGYRNFSLKSGDGTNGWEAYQPYDAMLVAAGGPEIPVPLVKQLKPGGRMVIPVGADHRSQNLVRVTRTEKGYTQENFGPCVFVPLIGAHGWK
jgi:protein-L-isoaspartate(D-aspartate) O-methyltransferase